MQRSTISNKAADWKQTSTRNFIKNNTHQQFFKFYNEVHIVLKCAVHYAVSVLTFSFHPVFVIFPKVISELQIQWYIDKIFSLPPMPLVGTIHYLHVQDS